MKTVIVAAAALLAGLAPDVLAEPLPPTRGKELAALERKILGAWEGQDPCAGRLLFRADGTYELRGYGPAADDSTGTWKVRWDALPATLVLTCKASEVPDEAGKATELKLTRLDDDGLAVQYVSQTAHHYARVKR